MFVPRSATAVLGCAATAWQAVAVMDEGEGGDGEGESWREWLSDDNWAAMRAAGGSESTAGARRATLLPAGAPVVPRALVEPCGACDSSHRNCAKYSPVPSLPPSTLFLGSSPHPPVAFAPLPSLTHFSPHLLAAHARGYL